jgi:hypothetical protein
MVAEFDPDEEHGGHRRRPRIQYDFLVVATGLHWTSR